MQRIPHFPPHPRVLFTSTVAIRVGSSLTALGTEVVFEIDRNGSISVLDSGPGIPCHRHPQATEIAPERMTNGPVAASLPLPHLRARWGKPQLCSCRTLPLIRAGIRAQHAGEA